MFSHHWGPGPMGELRNLLWKHFEGKQWSALSPAAHRGTGDNIHQKWVRRVKVQDGNNRLWVLLHCRKAAQWVNLILVQCAGTVMDCCLVVQLHSVYNNILYNWTTRLRSAVVLNLVFPWCWIAEIGRSELTVGSSPRHHKASPTCLICHHLHYLFIIIVLVVKLKLSIHLPNGPWVSSVKDKK